MLGHIFWYLLGFALVWIGSGLVVRDIDVLSKRLHFSSFAVSFLFLGFFTSVSEMSVGVNAVMARNPQIFVGNLLGASIVLFLLIIPLLAVVGNGLNMVHDLQRRHLIFTMIVIAAPVLVAFDHEISLADALILIVLYGYLFKTLHEARGLRNFLRSLLVFRESAMLQILVKMIVGIGLIVYAARILVQQTESVAASIGTSSLIVSMLVIAVGTNIPEISIAIRSLLGGKRDVALGNYLGSSAFNTLLIGGLTMLYGERVILTESFLIPLVFLGLALGLFYWFGRSGGKITRQEGWVLLTLYVFFVILQIA